MRSRVALRLPALVLAVVMTAVSSGLPSHHHGDDASGPVVADAGHHGHGTLLVEQSERQTSQASAIPLPSEATVSFAEPVLKAFTPFAATRQLAPGGLPPPSERPRAPPVSV